MKRKKENTKHKSLFYKVISFMLLLSSIVFIGLLSYLDLLPSKYFKIIVSIVLIFDIFNIIFINLKRLKKKIKRFMSIFVILATLIMSIVTFYLGRTLGVLSSNGDAKYKLENYSLIVLKNSNYSKLNDIKGKTVGYYINSTGTDEAKEYLSSQTNVVFTSYKTSDSLVSSLLNSDLEAIMVEDSILKIMEEETSDFNKLVDVLYTFKVKVKAQSTLKDVNVTKDSFSIYISGIDTYGEISSVSRSDVNIVMVVNPKIKQILLISIPRDYYVQLHGTTGTRDKLTHAGIYGIDMSVKTLEDLLEMDINYYIKVNFTSVIDIVDALEGLDVYSEYSFVSYSGFSFKKGYNSVNGEQALDFARTRKAFADGDRQRGKNHQALIEAIIRKATSKSIITKYNSLLSAIDGKYQTNMGIKKITSLIKMQLNDMPSWNVTSFSLTGTDTYNYTYTYNQLLYVMEPDEESVETAIDLIDSVLDDKSLDSSYSELSSSINKVSSVKSSTINSSNSSINNSDKTTIVKEESSEDISEDNQTTQNDKDIEDENDNNNENDNLVVDQDNDAEDTPINPSSEEN